MKQNVGNLDRYIRLVLAVGFIVAGVLTVSSTLWLSIIFFVLAVTLTVTALIRRCPLYLPFGISTHRRKDAPKSE